MDLGLHAVELREFAYFTANKPDVFKKEQFRFLVAQYIEFKGSIDVQLSHLSVSSSPDELAAECKEDVGLAAAALVPDMERSEGDTPSNTSEEALFCANIRTMFFGTETTSQFLSRELSQPDDNLCRHIWFYARVSSTKNDTSVHCFKNFFSPEIEVTKEAKE
jgi:hypothetical protein